MRALAENRAAQSPHKVLTRRQREALLAIDGYVHRRKRGGVWLIGPQRFAASIIETLARHQLVREVNDNLSLTLLGQTAAARLKERAE